MAEAAARDSKYILGVNIANVFIMMAWSRGNILTLPADE